MPLSPPPAPVSPCTPENTSSVSRQARALAREKKLSRLQNEARFLGSRNGYLREIGRLIKIGIEFFRGFYHLHGIGPAITVFGSARFKDDHPYYQQAREIGALLAREGYTVMTGGGPGIMEAASRGAKEIGGRTVGCNIVLPHEQKPNPYLDQIITFYYFFVRKVMLVKYSYGFVILPGGLGTLDEMTEAMTLIQTGKLYDFPVILLGTEYWKGLQQWIQSSLVTSGAVTQDDLDFIHITDDPNEVITIIRQTVHGLGLRLRALPANVD